MSELSSILIRGGVLIALILLWIVEYNENFIDARMDNNTCEV
ncbi:hypothetical protein [African swine fever virus]